MPRLTYNDKKAEDTYRLNRPEISVNSFAKGVDDYSVGISADKGNSSISARANVTKNSVGDDTYGAKFTYSKKF